MPAPLKEEVKRFIIAALVDTTVNGTHPSQPRIPGKRQAFLEPRPDGTYIDGKLPVAMEDLVDGIAEGINKFWTVWQATQTVTILPPPNGTVAETIPPFAPVAGVSGPGSLV